VIAVCDSYILTRRYIPYLSGMMPVGLWQEKEIAFI